MSLNGKTLFITGASRGIGLAIALRAARDGANVAVVAKTDAPHPKLPGTIHSAAAEIEAMGGHALPLAVDIRDENQVTDAVARTVAAFGGIDVVVNNASAIHLADVQHTEIRRFDLMQAVNTRGSLVVSKLAIPHLERAANPHILMLSPPLDMKERWFAPHAPYSIAKFGMSLLALGLAGELRGKGIAVNALWPRTIIATAAVRNLLGGGSGHRRIAPAEHRGRRGLSCLSEALPQLLREFPHRRHVPRRRRRDRPREVPGRSDAAAHPRLLRAGRRDAANRPPIAATRPPSEFS